MCRWATHSKSRQRLDQEEVRPAPFPVDPVDLVAPVAPAAFRQLVVDQARRVVVRRQAGLAVDSLAHPRRAVGPAAAAVVALAAVAAVAQTHSTR